MKPITTIAVLLLGFIAVMQGLRFAFAWPITVNGYLVPVWASAVAFVFLGGLAVMLWREGRR
jgi:hypothetical protein